VLELADARPAGLARRAAPDHDVARLVAEAAAAVAAAGAVGAGGVIALRRLAGAIEPAGAAALGAAVVVGIALVLAADVARRWNRGASLLPPLAARAGLVLAVVALAWPPRAAGWPAVATAAGAAGAALAAWPRAGSRRGRLESSSGRRRGPAAGPAPGRRRDPQPGQVRQRFERRELEAGGERVRGRIVVAIPAGAKAGYGHLGFCPAFVTTPTVQVSTAYDGVEAVVSAAEVLPWGVRVECRLAEPAEEPVEIPVDLVAEAPA
jgi:hypothetical protein